MRKTLVVLLAMTVTATALDAQVGYPPSQSPFRDLFYRQEGTLFTGYFAAGSDPVGVGPQSGPMVGARYEVRIGGPAQFSIRAARVFTERRILDPSKPVGQRFVDTRSMPLYLMDMGITFNLTGQKSYRGFVPVASVGGGVASNLSSKLDVGEFKFGTPFAISLGGGVRYVSDGPFQLRLDVLDYLYQIRYPNTYFQSVGGVAPVRRGSQSAWTQNMAVTVGASYQFFR